MDFAYQPVDLSNGLCLDRESLRSEVTSFHSASNTTDDLAKSTASKMAIVIANKGDTFSSTEDLNSNTNLSGGNLNQFKEVPLECGTAIDNHSMLDSCIGSSIAGETSSGLRSSSTNLYSPDTSSSSFDHSNDTSATSDYIATNSGTSRSPSLSNPPTPTALATTPLTEQPHQPLENQKQSTNDSAKQNDSTLPANGRKDLLKNKDYIHATNALFSVISDDPHSSNC